MSAAAPAAAAATAASFAARDSHESDSKKAQRIINALKAEADWANELRVSATEWKELCRFLILKAMDGDVRTITTGTHSPSPPLDAVWHRAMLRPVAYRDLCEKITVECGGERAIIDHDPRRVSDDMSVKASRFSSTLLRYQTLFGERASGPIWEYPEAIAAIRGVLPAAAGGSDPQPQRHVAPPMTSSSSSSGGSSSSEPPRPAAAAAVCPTTLATRASDMSFIVFAHCIHFDLRVFPLLVRRSDTVLSVKQKLEPICDTPAEQQRFFFGHKPLEDTHTLGEYNVENLAILHMIERLRGC
jgi:hypothetical protein